MSRTLALTLVTLCSACGRSMVFEDGGATSTASSGTTGGACQGPAQPCDLYAPPPNATDYLFCCAGICGSPESEGQGICPGTGASTSSGTTGATSGHSTSGTSGDFGGCSETNFCACINFCVSTCRCGDGGCPLTQVCEGVCPNSCPSGEACAYQSGGAFMCSPLCTGGTDEQGSCQAGMTCQGVCT